MNKLPPPPPPPPPGRGRPQGSKPPRLPKPEGGENARRGLPRWIIWVLAGLLLATILVPSLLPSDDGDSISYTEFIAAVDDGDVASVEINNGTGQIKGEFTDGEKFVTTG